MKHHPTLFSTEMVEAILAGRKTMTRRIVTQRNCKLTTKFENINLASATSNYPFGFSACGNTRGDLVYGVEPIWSVGDILWVRETFEHGCMGGYIYKAGRTDEEKEAYKKAGYKWKPSIHMPCEACRIRLRIVDVKAEYIEDISKEDAIAEGIETWVEKWCGIRRYRYYPNLGGFWDDGEMQRLGGVHPAIASFRSLWSMIYGHANLMSNPLVWAIKFERLGI